MSSPPNVGLGQAATKAIDREGRSQQIEIMTLSN